MLLINRIEQLNWSTISFQKNTQTVAHENDNFLYYFHLYISVYLIPDWNAIYQNKIKNVRDKIRLINYHISKVDV